MTFNITAEICPNLIAEDETENSKSPPSTPKDDSLGPIEEVDGKILKEKK